MKSCRSIKAVLFFMVALGTVTFLGCEKKSAEKPKAVQERPPQIQPLAQVRVADADSAVELPETPYLAIANELVVLLKDGETVESFKESVAGKGIKVVGGIPNFGMLQIEVQADQRETLMEELQQNPLVESVSHQTIYGTDTKFNDPTLTNDDVWDDWGLQAIETEEAWKTTRGDPDLIVAVVDTGMRLDHEELKGKIVAPTSFFSDNGTHVGNPEELTHGTFVAVIAAGNGNNALGTSGVAPDCRVMPVQVSKGHGAPFTQILAGIDYAVQNGATVINVSMSKKFSYKGMIALLFGDIHEQYNDPITRDSAKSYLLRMRKQDEAILHKVLTAAENAGVTVVVAAGNDSLPGDFGHLCHDSLSLCVGNVGQYADRVLTPVSHSNYGFMVRVSAPGTDIYSGNGEPGGHGYQWAGGTSAAAPYVTGLAALIASANPNLKPYEIRQAIVNSALYDNSDKSAPVQWHSSAQKVFREMDLWHRAFMILTGKDENLLLPDEVEQLLVSLIPLEHNAVWDGPYQRQVEAVWHDEMAVGAFINAPAALKSAASGSFGKKFAAFTKEEIEQAQNIKPEKLLAVHDMLKMADRYSASSDLGVPFILKFNPALERLDVIREKNPGGGYAEWLEYTAPGQYRHFAMFDGKDYRQGPVRLGRKGKVSDILNPLKDEVFYYQSLE